MIVGLSVSGVRVASGGGVLIGAGVGIEIEGVQAACSMVDQKLGHLRRGDRQHLDFSPAERKRMKKEKPGP